MKRSIAGAPYTILSGWFIRIASSNRAAPELAALAFDDAAATEFVPHTRKEFVPKQRKVRA
jgi:hypothetical protein